MYNWYLLTNTVTIARRYLCTHVPHSLSQPYHLLFRAGPSHPWTALRRVASSWSSASPMLGRLGEQLMLIDNGILWLTNLGMEDITCLGKPWEINGKSAINVNMSIARLVCQRENNESWLDGSLTHMYTNLQSTMSNVNYLLWKLLGIVWSIWSIVGFL